MKDRVLITTIMVIAILVTSCLSPAARPENAAPQEALAPSETATKQPTPSSQPTATVTATAKPTAKPAATATPLPEGMLFRDDFTGSLQTGWEWINERPERWSFTEDGYLQIVAAEDSAPQGEVRDNTLLRPIPDGDFVMTTHIQAEPYSNFQNVGIVVFNDVENFVSVERGYCAPCLPGGNGFYMDIVVNGATMTHKIASDAKDAYLKIERIDGKLTGYYAIKPDEWVMIGHFGNTFEYKKVGLGVASLGADVIVGSYDYFEISEPEIQTPTFVPRYMLPAAPYMPLWVAATSCSYKTDQWSQTSAYAAYTCPAVNIDPLMIQFTNLEEGKTAKDLFGEMPDADSELMTLGAWFNDIDNVTISGKIENDKYVYFMVYETERYVISAQASFSKTADTNLSDHYKENAERILNAVLDLMIAKVKTESGEALPTQLAPDQRALYSSIAALLVTEVEANEAYVDAPDMFGDAFDGTWVLQDDYVDAKYNQICRKFEDRTNEDTPLVAFGNCLFIRPDFKLDDLKQNFRNAIELRSEQPYSVPAVFYGGKMENGHTNLNGYILVGDKLFYIWMDSRTLSGSSIESIFKGFNDKFIYEMLMRNLERLKGS